ncbi:hypothetical protein VPNG_09662 [Cytospora leucostoma]|uniref:Uncharacterized protein n=1 Tax=Cytospora leucostoma TaxID=1230097 RepID=A0A423VMN6_9PEZI|nr:hypothetical protein VPNG_09662 [Cytospora leucostoma]
MSQAAPLPHNAELFQQIEALSARATNILAFRRSCTCPRDNNRKPSGQSREWSHGVDPDLLRQLRELRDGGPNIEDPNQQHRRRHRDGNDADGNDANDDVDLHSNLRALEARVRRLVDRNRPCDCPHCPRDESSPESITILPRNLTNLPGEVRNMIWSRYLDGVPTLFGAHPVQGLVGAGSHRTAHDSLFPNHAEETDVITYTHDSRGWPPVELGPPQELYLLRAARQINQEVSTLYYGQMLTFNAAGPRETYCHAGLLTAHAFLTDRRPETLPLIRALRINMTQSMGEGDQMLADICGLHTPGVMVQLVGLIAQLPALQRLDLIFTGWPPDMRMHPWNNVPPTEFPERMSDDALVGSPWIRALRGLRRIDRVGLHVEANLGEDQAGSSDDYTREHVRRVVYFVRAVRNSILREGGRLRNDMIHVFFPHARDVDIVANLVVECDTEYVEERGAFSALRDIHLDYVHRQRAELFDPDPEDQFPPLDYSDSDDGSRDSLNSHDSWALDSDGDPDEAVEGWDDISMRDEDDSYPPVIVISDGSEDG